MAPVSSTGRDTSGISGTVAGTSETLKVFWYGVG